LSDPSPDHSLGALKDRIFGKLAELNCVSGVGISSSKLTVYLANPPNPDEAERIRDVLSTEAPGREVVFTHSGPFKTQ
jgi:hypothetical protein